MVKHKTSCRIGTLFFILLSIVSLANTAPCKQRSIVLSLPAETVLSSVQKMLPLAIPSQSRRLQGDIIVESLSSLTIADNAITLRGVLTGRNLMVTTRIGGQNFQLRLGEVRLPIACTLKTRFDPANRKLYVIPSFPDSPNGDGDLGPLLGALTNREYQVDLHALESLKIRMGDKTIPIALDPVKITGSNNTLVFHMLPRVGTPR